MSKFNNKFYLFANWKMYLDYTESIALAAALVKEAPHFMDKINMTLFPSALALPEVAKEAQGSGLSVGGQNIYLVEKGGYTGEISTSMIKAVGAEFVLIGHSERRHLFHETNHETRQKIEAVLTANLTPVFCIGEKLEERNEGKTLEVVEAQLRAGLDGLIWPQKKELIVAYEPVWAIGTGEACDVIEAEKVHSYIHSLIEKFFPGTIPVLLYGGSVRANNVVGYLDQPHINGVLVGGASAKFDSWQEIIKVCTM